jgi:hypothetical protein
MAWPVSLQVALKEWAVVCEALACGRQILLLRKGGIHDAGGEFELQHRHFLLFPTFVHQDARMLKPSEQQRIEPRSVEPQHVSITTAGVVSDILQLRDRQQMDALQDEHIWSESMIDMRFRYRPENPLYLLLVRAYRLRAPFLLANTPAYAGCKSWVPLEHPIELGEALPVLDDLRYEHRIRTIQERLRCVRA